MTITARRWMNVGLTLAVAVVLLGAHALLQVGLHRVEMYSGWLLLTLLLVLTFFNLRKWLTTIPVGRSSLWTQVHVYAGLVSIAVFLLHTGGRLPNGRLERTLAILYGLVVVTGLVSLFITRAFPRRLRSRGEEVLFERIPRFRHVLRERAEALVLRSVGEGNSTTIADFYHLRLAAFLARPRHFWAQLLGATGRRDALLAESEALARYLNEKERAKLAELIGVIEQKDDLDFHAALQSVLKYWLFMHIPLTYSLLVFVAVHVVAVHVYAGGLR